MTLPATTERVIRNTSESVNRRIHERTEESLRYHERHPERIDARLRELDREWDIERAIESNASVLVVAGSVLGLTVDRRFMLLPLVVGGFLLQHALQGWCPPVPILRRLGVRTCREIDLEREALRNLQQPPVTL